MAARSTAPPCTWITSAARHARPLFSESARSDAEKTRKLTGRRGWSVTDMAVRRRCSPSALNGRGAGEVGVGELDGHCSFADGGGASFGRSGADVASGEHAGDIGLEQVVHVCGRAGE